MNNLIAVNTTHAVAITADNVLAVWGEDTDHHFTKLDSAVHPDESPYGTLRLVWDGVVYRPKTVATRGPITAVVAAAPPKVIGSKIDDIRKVLLAIKKEYDQRGCSSYFELFKKLQESIDKDDAAARRKVLIDISSKDKSGFVSGVSRIVADGAPGMQNSSSIMKDGRPPVDLPEEDRKGPEPVIPGEEGLMHEVDIVHKREKELRKQFLAEQNDEGFIEDTNLQKILREVFNFAPQECDMFLHEMAEFAAHRRHAGVSIRAIKDCINAARLDDGRLFLFMSKNNKAVKIATCPIDTATNLSLLYNPGAYEPIESVACGACHLLLLTKSGAIYACGDSSQGALGLGHIEGNIMLPMRVEIKKHNGVRSVRMIAAGREHSMCLTTSDEVFTWGNGLKGKLGHGDENDQKAPREVVLLHQYTPRFIAAGDAHSACVTAGGKLYTWGDGQYGKLGHNSTQPELNPMKVAVLADIEIMNVSCGAFHTLAVDKSGKTYGFGQPKGGKLGVAETEHTEVPCQIQDFQNIRFVVAGVWNSYGVEAYNKVYSWGSTEKKMLGRAENAKKPYQPERMGWLQLARLEEVRAVAQRDALFSTKVAKTVCSFKNTFAITDAGEVYVLGSNEHGQAGIAPRPGRRHFKKPYKIPKFTPESGHLVDVLACGYSHVLAVTKARKLFAWGANDCGQLGNGRKEPVFEPTPVEAFKGEVVEFCACGDEYSAVINEEGELFTFGAHAKGRLGLGPLDETGRQLIPKKVDLPGFPHIRYICCGVNHVLAIPDYDSEDAKADKGVWSWGLSSRGQLGHGNKETLYSPRLIQKVSSERFRKVCCGFEHSMGLTEEGKLYFWGAQEYYLRSEFGSTEDKDEPVTMQASSTDRITDIEVSHTYNLAIGQSQDVIYWGSFFKDLVQQRSGANVKGIVIESKLGIKAKQIACGPNHAAAIRLDEGLYTWGHDSDGALGVSTGKSKQARAPELVWTVKAAIDKAMKTAQVETKQVDTKRVEDEDKEQERRDDVPVKDGKEEKKEGETGRQEDAAAEKVHIGKARDASSTELSENTKVTALQKTLKEGVDSTQDYLIKKQRKVQREFERALKRFNDVRKTAQLGRFKAQACAINLISRLENGPFPMKRKLHLLQRKSPAINQSKKELKEIFQALYMHPCYINMLLRKNMADQAVLSALINSLYATSCDRKYTRVLLMNLGMLIFKKELASSSGNKLELVDKQDYAKTSTLFAQIFDLIFKNDNKCMYFAASLAGLCFNDMYRAVVQRFPEEPHNSFHEMTGSPSSETNRKTIEGKLKSRCECIKTIMENICQRLIDDLEPDKQAGAMFVAEKAFHLPNVVKNLLEFCGAQIRGAHHDPKVNVDVAIATTLLPLVMKHVCHVLQKADLLLLYNSGEKNRKDVLHDEVKKHADNASVIAHVLMCYVTGTKSFAEISNFRMIQEFNKEIKSKEELLSNIYKEMIRKINKESFIKAYVSDSCSFEKTVVSFSNTQIKSLVEILRNNANELALIRPIDNDPVYKNSRLINGSLIARLQSGTKPLNFRINVHPLQDDPTLLRCKLCNSFVTQKNSNPYCIKFVDEVPRRDSLSMVYLYEKILTYSDDIMPGEVGDGLIEKIYDQANKRGSFELAEYCEDFIGIVRKSSHGVDKEMDEARVLVIRDYNSRLKLSVNLDNKRAAISTLDKRIETKLNSFKVKEEETYPLITINTQFGLANKELVDAARRGQGMTQVQAAINYIESMEISSELFQYLTDTEKQQLKPFVKRSVPYLMKRGVIQSAYIPNVEPILSNCSLVLSFCSNADVDIELVYQDQKDTVCGTIESEVEAKLFTYTFSVQDAFEVFKRAHKYSPETERTLTIEKDNQNAIVFGLDQFMKYYGEMRRQADAYVHRAKIDEAPTADEKETKRE